MGRPQHRRRADLQEEERERMLTSLPNILTMSRIAAIPLLLALIYVDTPLYRWVALAGYVVACVTDYFDGYFARHMKQISPLGRFLDPIADKLLVATLIVMLVATQQIADLEMIPAIGILTREILASGLHAYLANIQLLVAVTPTHKSTRAHNQLSLDLSHVHPAR